MKSNQLLKKTTHPILILLILAACSPLRNSSSPTPAKVPTSTAIPQIQVSSVMTIPSRVVYDVAWLPDGASIAVATAEGVYLHDAQTQEQLDFWPTEEAVIHLDVMPERDQILLGLRSGQINVFTLAGELIASLNPPLTEGITAWAISPDASLLGVVYESQAVFWDSGEFSLRFLVENPADQRIAGLHFSPDGAGAELLIFPSYRCLVDIGNESIVEENCDIYSLDGVSFSGYRFVSSSIDGRHHAVLHRNGTVQLFEINESNQEQVQLVVSGGDHGSGFGIEVSIDGEWLAVSYDAGLLLYPRNNSDLSQTFDIRPHSLAFSPDAQELIVGGPWTTLRTINLATGEETLWPLYRGRLSAVAASISEDWVALGYLSGEIQVISFEHFEISHEFRPGLKYPLRWMFPTSNGVYVESSLDSLRAHRIIVDLQTGEVAEAESLPLHLPITPQPGASSPAPFFLELDDGSLTIFAVNGTVSRQIDHVDRISAAFIFRQGAEYFLALADMLGDVSIWRLWLE